jgi:hypothetical protein
VAGSASRLGRPEHRPVEADHQRTGERDHAPVEIDVAPLQREQLTSPRPRRGRQPQQTPQQRPVDHHAQQRGHLGSGGRSQLAHRRAVR